MARSRILDPGFFTNEDLLELPLEARVLFAGLWCLADREGRLEDRPKRIKIELFPGDNYDVDLLLQALLSRGFIHRYAVPGHNLIHVRNFLKYQRCHPREAQSVWPECPCMADTESLGDAKDQPRTDLGTAKVFGLGSPRTKGSPEVSEDEGAAAPAKPRLRKIEPEDVSRWEGEYPAVDIPAMVADYLNWSGSSKHVNKVLGFQNQLRDQWRLEKFRKQAPTVGQNVMDIHKRNKELERIAWERKNPGIPFEVPS